MPALNALANDDCDDDISPARTSSPRKGTLTSVDELGGLDAAVAEAAP